VVDLDEGFEPQVGEIRALRTFRVGPGGLLYPLFSRDAWRDGDNHAYCRIQRGVEFLEAKHNAPDPGCMCGFYAYGNARAATEYPHARYVLAVVECWGRTIVGTQGLRSEWCRIVALWFADSVPSELIKEAGRRYRSAQLYTDKNEMLRDYPLTSVDGYEFAEEHIKERRLHFARVALAVAVVLTALPTAWWHSAALGWTAWLSALAALVLAGRSLPRRTAADRRAGSTANRYRLLLTTVALWMLAPLAGTAGALLLRLPLFQIAVLVMLQRHRLVRDARRFPSVME
jgi:hypothetical protein